MNYHLKYQNFNSLRRTLHRVENSAIARPQEHKNKNFVFINAKFNAMPHGHRIKFTEQQHDFGPDSLSQKQTL